MEDFYICHPDARKSCAACCGIYNYENFDRSVVAEALDFRTSLFMELRPTGDDLDEFRRLVDRIDTRPRLLEDIHCCEFFGFVDSDKRKVGCLIHPLVTRSHDERDRAFYGAETCALHKCGSYQYFNAADVAPVVAALDDWYLYGICITDVDLVLEFYKLVSDEIHRTLHPRKIVSNEKALGVFRQYLELKETFPFRRGRRRFGQYVFERGTYSVAETDWAKLGVPRPREWRILRSLGAELTSSSELEKAVRIVRRFIEQMAELVS